jgi:hypothetical protein
MQTEKDKFTSLMKKYWDKELTQDNLLNEYAGKFSTEDLIKALEQNYSEKEAAATESIFHLGFTFNLFTKETVSILCKYLTECWHKRHEDIASILQKLKDENSISSIVKAVHINCDYWYDDGDAFIRKCIYVLSDINTKDSLEQLQILANDPNNIIKKYAVKELSKK